MGILIGMDEAGYGPNFGPLVVAATAWEVAEEMSGVRSQVSENGELTAACNGILASAARPNLPERVLCRLPGRMPGLGEFDLYSLLRNIVAKSASERRIAIADSKILFHPGLGLRQLERGIHAVLLSLRQLSGRWSELVDLCGADPEGHHGRICWPDGFDCTLPVDATADELSRLSVRLTRACDAAGVRPLAIRAGLVFPAQFNELVDYYGTKGAALSHVTVGLLREVVEAVSAVSRPDKKRTGTDRHVATERHIAATVGASPLFVVCDKHGGRNYYTALLQHHFSEHWIEPVFESHAESRYEWGPPEARVHVTFRMNGERFLPTALASMTAKYLRELAMRAFNEFWCAHVPNLRPTAGYPMDSHRFRKAIAITQRELGIDDYDVWRKK